MNNTKYKSNVLKFSHFVMVIIVSLGANTIAAVNLGDNEMTIWHLGRFSFVLSEQFKLSGREQSIYHVNVSSIPLGSKSALEHWQSKLLEIKSLKVIVNEKEPMKDVLSVFYHQKHSLPIAITLLAQKIDGNSVITASYEGKKDKQHNIIKLVSIVLNKYRKGNTAGFSIGTGVITSEPSVNEYAMASLKDSLSDIELIVTITTANKYLNDDPLEDIQADITAFGEEGLNIKVLKNKNRKVNGYKGKEGIVSIEEDDKALLRYTWFTSGKTADAFTPEISIKAFVPKEHAENFNQQWNNFLESLILRY